jgi:hypothetical protein
MIGWVAGSASRQTAVAKKPAGSHPTSRSRACARGHEAVSSLPAFWCEDARKQFGGVAQSVEQRPFKPVVAGSSPAAPTTLDAIVVMVAL